MFGLSPSTMTMLFRSSKVNMPDPPSCNRCGRQNRNLGRDGACRGHRRSPKVYNYHYHYHLYMPDGDSDVKSLISQLNDADQQPSSIDIIELPADTKSNYAGDMARKPPRVHSETKPIWCPRATEELHCANAFPPILQAGSRDSDAVGQTDYPAPTYR